MCCIFSVQPFNIVDSQKRPTQTGFVSLSASCSPCSPTELFRAPTSADKIEIVPFPQESAPYLPFTAASKSGTSDFYKSLFCSKYRRENAHNFCDLPIFLDIFTVVLSALYSQIFGEKLNLSSSSSYSTFPDRAIVSFFEIMYTCIYRQKTTSPLWYDSDTSQAYINWGLLYRRHTLVIGDPKYRRIG